MVTGPVAVGVELDDDCAQAAVTSAAMQASAAAG
jgi:hypothetical protein